MGTTPERAARRTGYDPDFLGARVDPPAAPGPAAESRLLPYTHFTVCLSTRRRLAWWVAWNIDGHRLHPGDDGVLGHDGIDFVADDRVPPEHQALEEVYADNRFDRGRLARRADLLWGELDEARAANLDAFHFPNIAPQLDVFNQSGRAGDLPAPDPGSAAESWGLLENAVLAFEGLDDRRISVLGGPVLAEDDEELYGLLIPREFWKVVVYRVHGALRCQAFVLSQDISQARVRRLDYLQQFRTYAVALADLEERTGLSFATVSEAAGADGARTARPGEPVRISALADVSW